MTLLFGDAVTVAIGYLSVSRPDALAAPAMDELAKDAVFGDVDAVFVGLAVGHARLDPGTREPGAEGVGMVIAAAHAWGVIGGGAAKLGGEEDEGVFEQAAWF